ncbi:RNA-dependent RNA polymerase [Perkerra virus]|uniref:RNA-directed RNA polymerase L n=1 Tax=Perkerra virus TaxID=2767010 RepID=A0A7G8PYK6_9VIRU|nr:RNA-dependent RNA polymerase [Perkerra virus]QNJ99612.1 RNA-dependent RNA polymerase [Perkerra virus]
MITILNKQPALQDGFTKRPVRHYDESLLGAILPDFEVHKTLTGVEIDMELGGLSATSTIGSTLVRRQTLTANNLPNFVHDFTFGHLEADTDKMLSSVFGVRGDGYDHLSPDMIVKSTANTYFVIEFTTFRGQQEGARRAALNKFSKYEIPCENRSVGNKVSLSVLSVHRTGLWSNLDMDDDDVNEIVFRFRLAVSIYEEIKILFPDLTDDSSELDKTDRLVLGIMSHIQDNWDVTEQSFPSFKRHLFETFRECEPDEEYLVSIISKCLETAQKELLKNINPDVTREQRLQANEEDARKKVKAAMDSYVGARTMRNIYDSKSTCQIPPWVFVEADEGKDLMALKDLEVTGSYPMANIWKEVVYQANQENIERMDDFQHLELQQALEGPEARPDERNKYHRVRIQLEDEDKKYIAALGVNGKAYKNESSSEIARERSKLPFSPDHDVSDLESFLSNRRDFSLFKPMTDELFCPFREDTALRVSAAKIHQPTLINETGTNEMITAHLEYLDSPLGSWCQTVSLIGSELSASVKQHVKPNHYVVKRLKGSPFYMLIKPTSSKSHIFVSFALIKRYHYIDLHDGHVFKKYFDCGDLLITDFVSFKLSKLTNLCKCAALMECAACYWAECYGIEPWEAFSSLSAVDSFSRHECSFMTKLSLLTLLEDKAVTEELQTILRYIMMEGFVSLPEIPNPQKMTSKFPKVLRTELQVYLLNRVSDSILRIAGQPFVLKKKDGSISWSRLFNPLTQSPLSEIQPLISCCYNGYFKNKEEETEPSALSAMYKKIIELEHLRPPTDDFLGWGDPENPQMHEFSRSYLKKLCTHAKQTLKRTYGANYMTQIDNQILRDIGSITLERLATLKATSQFDENWYVYKDVKDKNYTRDKLLFKMSKFADEGKALAIEKFEECMSLIERRGAMHICLFKKAQHGGLREIYVLGAEERIVQCIIESISRSIGRFFHSDTLCNPGNKTRIPETHGSRAKKQCKSAIWTTATSDDARKWNQGHFVTKFALMLCEFTSPKWWPIIIRGCSMFTNKRMMMNLEFLKILDSHRELNIEDQFVTDLFQGYHGDKDLPWIEAGKTYLTTSTGMMQGILHFTSSLLHTIHQEFIRTMSFKIFDMKVKPEMSNRVVIDMMQGSDDSSMLISFPSDDDQVLTRCKLTAAICFRIKKSLGIYLGIYPSEKSTANTDFVMEYNSEFYFHSQHVRPTIRWIAACCTLPEVETLVARQEEASNLMTSVSEGGGSFALSAMVQQAQCMLHYELMGMGVSSLFREYSRAILKWNDPGLGFFLLDNPYSAGLGGFRYNLYKAITRTNLQKVYAFFMRKVRGDGDDASDIPETCSVSPGGALIMSSSLRWGSKKKFDKLRSRLNIPEDWIDQIDDNPEILYRAPRTGKEIILRIAEKLHSPGVVSSLSNGNSVCRVMASAVYFLSAAIFQDVGKPEFSIFNESKYSLLQKLMAYEGLGGIKDITPEDILFLFPNIEELESLDVVVFDKGAVEISKRVSGREATQTKVVVFEARQVQASPEKLVSDKWFGTQKTKIGATAFKREWDRLTRVIKWLRDTPDETREVSPLHNQIQIRNFFARLETKPRTVRVTGAPVKKRSGISKLAMVVRDNFSRNGFVKGIEDITGSTRSVHSEAVRHLMFAALQGPYSQSTKEDLVMKILFETDPIPLKPQEGKTKSNILSLCQRFVQKEKNILDSIETMGAGTIGGFIKRQKDQYDPVKKIVQYYGPGSWRGVMDGVQIQIDVDNKIGMPTYITAVHIAESSSGPWELSQSIRKWAEDMNIGNSVDLAKSSQRGARYWMHDFRMLGASYPFGSPVYIVKDRIVMNRVIDEKKLQITIRRNTMNLSLKGEGRVLNILSYTSSDYDMSPKSLNIQNHGIQSALGHFQFEPSKSWVYCQPLPQRYVPRIAQLCTGKSYAHRIDRVSLAELVKICTESTMRSKVGAKFSDIPVTATTTQNFDLSSIVDIMIEDSGADAFNLIASELEEDIKMDYDAVEFERDDIDIFGPSHYKDLVNLSLLAHPLMDSFVETLICSMGRKDLRRLEESGRVHERFREKAEMLFTFLGRNVNSIVVENLYFEEEAVDSDEELG